MQFETLFLQELLNQWTLNQGKVGYGQCAVATGHFPNGNNHVVVNI